MFLTQLLREIERTLGVRVADDDMGPFGGETSHDSLPNACAGSGCYDCHLIV
jgi:hypothetical protein